MAYGAPVADTSQAEMSQSELRMLLRGSDEAFMEYFLVDQIEEGDQIQDFHLTTFGRFTDMSVPRDVCALPRDHAKTTYLRLAFVRQIVFTDLQFFVYMSATHGAAAASVEVIWGILTSPEFEAAFDICIPKIERLSEGTVVFWCMWYDENDVARKKLVILKALGAQQQLRGMNMYNLRPQYVGCDDIEDETAVKTQEGYEKFKTWFDNTFMRAVSRQKGRNKVCQIGNLIGMQTLLNDNLQDPDWRRMRVGVIRADGTPLWANRFPLDEIRRELMAAKRRGQLSAWFGEMMNMPINIETALADIDKLTFTKRRHPADGRNYKAFITIDPAISKKESADDCAIVLHTIDLESSEPPQITEYVCQKGMDPMDMAHVCLDMCERWDCKVIGGESVQMQSVLLSFLQLVFFQKNKYDYDFVEIKVGKTHKTARLRTWVSACYEGEYSLAHDDMGVVEQLLAFDVKSENNKDDLIDSCSMGLYMLDHYWDDITRDRAAQELSHARMLQAQRGPTLAY